ncbi:MAG: hypothetical protein V1858_02380 [Candidatus Gottesmanbacteria bacterium]
MKKLWLLTIIIFLIYFHPWNKDFPLPVYNTKESFNKTFSNYFYYSSEIKRGNLPFWNPLVANGSTFLAQTDYSLFNPLTLIVLRFLPFPLNLKILYLISFLIASTGMFLFLKSLKQKGNAFAGTCIFVFFGPFLSMVSDLNVLQTLSLVPWIFLLVNKSLALGGLVIALQVLSGPFELTLLTLFFVLIYYRSIRVIWTMIAGLCLSSIKLITFFDISSLTIAPLQYFYVASTNINSIRFFYPSIVTIISVFFIRKNVIYLFLVIFCLLMAFPAISPLYILYLTPPFFWINRPEIFLSFAGFFLGAIVSINWRRLFIIILFIELIVFNFLNLPKETAGQIMVSLEKKYPFINKIQKEKAKIWFNDSVLSTQIEPLEPNNNLLWGITSLNSYEPGTKRHQTYLSLLNPSANRLLSIQSVKYQVNPFKSINNPLPEVYTANKITLVKTTEQLIDLLLDKKFSPEKESLVEEKLRSTKITIVTQSYSKLFKNVVPVNLDQQGMVGDRKSSLDLQSLKIGITITLISLIFLILLNFSRWQLFFHHKSG